jgi:hypothetical protein
MYQPTFNEELDSFRPRWYRPVIAIVLIMAFVAFLVVILFTNMGSRDRLSGHALTVMPHGAARVEKPPPLIMTENGRRFANQAVYLTAMSDRGPQLASGFLVRADTVVTAAHFGGADPQDLKVNCGMKTVKGRRVFRDATRDVAFISAVGCPGAETTFDETPVNESDRLVVVAHRYEEAQHSAVRETLITSALPTGFDLWQDRPLTSRGGRAVRLIVESKTVLLSLSGELPDGISGAPVIRPDGRVVGMAIVRDELKERTYAVAASEIVAALREAHLG